MMKRKYLYMISLIFTIFIFFRALLPVILRGMICEISAKTNYKKNTNKTS